MKTNTTLPPADLAMDITKRIVEQITLHPKDIKIQEERLGRLATITIQVNRGDMKRVIGSGGAHASAITRLIDMIGRSKGVQLKSRIIEPDSGSDDKNAQFVPKQEWNSAPVRAVINDICETVFEYPATVEVHDGSNHLSVVDVAVSPDERKLLVDTMQPMLNPLVVAMGKVNGRHLSLNIAPTV